MPSSFGIWSTTITIAMPALKPVSTGAEMKSARNPRRRAAAASRVTPTISVSADTSPTISVPLADGPALATAPATRIASVDVVVTLKRRDVPASA